MIILLNPLIGCLLFDSWLVFWFGCCVVIGRSVFCLFVLCFQFIYKERPQKRARTEQGASIVMKEADTYQLLLVKAGPLIRVTDDITLQKHAVLWHTGDGQMSRTQPEGVSLLFRLSSASMVIVLDPKQPGETPSEAMTFASALAAVSSFPGCPDPVGAHIVLGHVLAGKVLRRDTQFNYYFVPKAENTIACDVVRDYDEKKWKLQVQ